MSKLVREYTRCCRIGIDTGGTCTDGVLIDDTTLKVVHSVKEPTTHHNLGIGVGRVLVHDGHVAVAAGRDVDQLLDRIPAEPVHAVPVADRGDDLAARRIDDDFTVFQWTRI